MSDKALIEAMARGIYERRHRGMKNVWPWDDSGLDDEHPGVRERIIADATAALAALRKTHETVRRDVLIELSDLLAERKHGSPARSPAHNARLIIDAILNASEATDAV